MSKIDELIAELCPDGVRSRYLWELTTWDKKFNAVDNSKQPKVLKYHYLLASELKPLIVPGGDIKLLTTNTSDLWTRSDLANANVSEGEIIAIPWGGNPNVQYYKGKFLTADNRIATSNNTDVLDNKYLYYFMINNLDLIGSFYRGSGIKHPSMAKILDMKIPVPPLEVQCEIVRVLDSFTELEAELEAELETRKKQYTHYRDNLLRFDESRGYEWVPFGNIGVNFDSKRRPVTKSDRHAGAIPYYGASGIVDYVKDYIFDDDYLLVSEDGANLLARSTPIAFSISGKTWVNNHAHVIKHDDYATRRFIEFYLNSIDLQSYISGGAQPKLNKANLNKIPIPLPPLPERQRIVEVLDKFDKLTVDMSEGLPAELTARRKQYEYYRNKLLTFKELPA